MKKIYIIQDVNNISNIIAFDTRKSMHTYLYKFNFEFKQNVECETNNVCLFGVISDCQDDNGYNDRAIYVREIETSRY